MVTVAQAGKIITPSYKAQPVFPPGFSTPRPCSDLSHLVSEKGSSRQLVHRAYEKQLAMGRRLQSGYQAEELRKILNRIGRAKNARSQKYWVAQTLKKETPIDTMKTSGTAILRSWL